MTEREHTNPKLIIDQFVQHICSQAQTFDDFEEGHAITAKRDIKADKEKTFQNDLKEILRNMRKENRKFVEGAKEKGTHSWLSALPIKSIGYALNKQVFVDAVCL